MQVRGRDFLPPRWDLCFERYLIVAVNYVAHDGPGLPRRSEPGLKIKFDSWRRRAAVWPIFGEPFSTMPCTRKMVGFVLWHV